MVDPAADDAERHRPDGDLQGGVRLTAALDRQPTRHHAATTMPRHRCGARTPGSEWVRASQTPVLGLGRAASGDTEARVTIAHGTAVPGDDGTPGWLAFDAPCSRLCTVLRVCLCSSLTIATALICDWTPLGTRPAALRLEGPNGLWKTPSPHKWVVLADQRRSVSSPPPGSADRPWRGRLVAGVDQLGHRLARALLGDQPLPDQHRVGTGGGVPDQVVWPLGRRIRRS